MRLLTVFLFAVFVATSGCTTDDIAPVGPGEKANRDNILAFLEEIGQEAMTGSFANLESFSYRRYLRTEQYDGDDFLLAFTEHIIETDGDPGARRSSVTQADSGGAFDFGFFNQFVSENVDDPDPVDLVPYLLEDNPSYLSPRNLDKYTFRANRDTLMWDRSARIIEVRARPDLADGENIRKVRYYVDRNSNQLVAMYLERIDLGLLFREESAFYMHVQLVDGMYVPYNTRFQTLISTPFKGSYRIRTVSTYTDYHRMATALPDSIQ
jgi:hypothetical protein